MSGTTIAELQKMIRRFIKERKWQRYHVPDKIATAIAVESGELQKLFLWVPQKVSDRAKKKDSAIRKKVEQELADILIYCLSFADRLDIDVPKIIKDKIRLNRKRYPIKRFAGSWKT